jgi:hypothetical protein
VRFPDLALTRDWQRRDATARYAGRTPVPPSTPQRPLSRWPFAVLFAVLFALAMLGLWWRERR